MGKSKCNKSSTRNNKNYGPDPDKSDKEVVLGSIDLLFPGKEKDKIDELLDKFLINSENTRRYGKMQRTEIGPPRPQNAFMLYRKVIKDRLTKNKRTLQCNVSKVTANLWNDESDEVLKVFYALQRMAEKKHKELYKDYKFIRKPKKKRTTRNENESSGSPPIVPHNPIQPIQPSTTNFISPNFRSDKDKLTTLHLQDNNPQDFISSNDDVPYLQDNNPQDFISSNDDVPYLQDNNSQDFISFNSNAPCLQDNNLASYLGLTNSQYSTDSYDSSNNIQDYVIYKDQMYILPSHHPNPNPNFGNTIEPGRFELDLGLEALQQGSAGALQQSDSGLEDILQQRYNGLELAGLQQNDLRLDTLRQCDFGLGDFEILNSLFFDSAILD